MFHHEDDLLRTVGFTSVASAWEPFYQDSLDLDHFSPQEDDPLIVIGYVGLFPTGTLDWEYSVRCLVCGVCVDRMNTARYLASVHGVRYFESFHHPASCLSGVTGQQDGFGSR